MYEKCYEIILAVLHQFKSGKMSEGISQDTYFPANSKQQSFQCLFNSSFYSVFKSKNAWSIKKESYNKEHKLIEWLWYSAN
jgi:hypothetical protein